MPKLANKPSNLGPSKGGPLFLPGFHRTKHEDAVAGIAFDGIVLGTGRMYGPGFYMTRTFSATNRSAMSHYGHHILRCQVEITGFLCFDKSVARRVWGPQCSLWDQIRAYPHKWSDLDLYNLKEASQALDNLWAKKSSGVAGWDRPNNIAKNIIQKFHLEKLVPGCAYTGAQDGACWVVYDLTRVKAVATVWEDEIPQGKRNVKQMPWKDLTCPKIKRALRPLFFLKEDSTNHRTVLLDLQKSGLLNDNGPALYRTLPDGIYNKLAFCKAVSDPRLVRQQPDFVQTVYRDAVETLIKEFGIYLPKWNWNPIHYDPVKALPVPSGSRKIKPANGYASQTELAIRKFQTYTKAFGRSRAFAQSYDAILLEQGLQHQQAGYDRIYLRLKRLKNRQSILRTLRRLFETFKGEQKRRRSKSLIKKRLPDIPMDCVEALMDVVRGKRHEYGSLVNQHPPKPVYYVRPVSIKAMERAYRIQLIAFCERVMADPVLMAKPEIRHAFEDWWQTKGHEYEWTILTEHWSKS